MTDLIVGIAIGIVVAVFIGAPLAALGKLAARMQDKGRRCAYRRPHPAVVLALGLLARPRAAGPPAPATWERIRAGMRPAPRRVDTSRTLAEMVGPIVTEAEVAEEFERRPLAPGRPTYYPRHDGSIVVGERNEVLVRPVNGRNLGTLPRLQTPDAPPWDIGTAQQPAVPAYGVASCQLDVAAAERAFALALGPDGCEET